MVDDWGRGRTELQAGGDDVWDHDQDGRLLRYISSRWGGGVDLGWEMLHSGYAIAHYDSRDGYGEHLREAAYIEDNWNRDPFAAACRPGPDDAAFDGRPIARAARHDGGLQPDVSEWLGPNSHAASTTTPSSRTTTQAPQQGATGTCTTPTTPRSAPRGEPDLRRRSGLVVGSGRRRRRSRLRMNLPALLVTVHYLASLCIGQSAAVRFVSNNHSGNTPVLGGVFGISGLTGHRRLNSSAAMVSARALT